MEGKLHRIYAAVISGGGHVTTLVLIFVGIYLFAHMQAQEPPLRRTLGGTVPPKARSGLRHLLENISSSRRLP